MCWENTTVSSENFRKFESSHPHSKLSYFENFQIKKNLKIMLNYGNILVFIFFDQHLWTINKFLKIEFCVIIFTTKKNSHNRKRTQIYNLEFKYRGFDQWQKFLTEFCLIQNRSQFTNILLLLTVKFGFFKIKYLLNFQFS